MIIDLIKKIGNKLLTCPGNQDSLLDAIMEIQDHTTKEIYYLTCFHNRYIEQNISCRGLA